MSPCRVVYNKLCHLPIEIEHRAWWAIKTLNFDLTETTEARKPSLSELDEIRAEAYESHYQKKRSRFHSYPTVHG